jgi:hypothetical protein
MKPDHRLLISDIPTVPREGEKQEEDSTGRHPPREIMIPLEASHDHLLVTPPSDITPQKVRD